MVAFAFGPTEVPRTQHPQKLGGVTGSMEVIKNIEQSDKKHKHSVRVVQQL